MHAELLPGCGLCPYHADERICKRPDGKSPENCPTAGRTGLRDACLERMKNDPALLRFAREAAWVEGAGYSHKDSTARPVRPRIAEIIDFCQRMGYKRLGLVFCNGLRHEAAATQKILEAHGFEPVSVTCKVGGTLKSELGLPPQAQVNPKCPESMCNPLMQAEICNAAAVDFNILLGLCVGHDSVALRHLKAPATVFAVKDRLLGHNPLAAIYTLKSYSRYLERPEEH